VVRGVSSCGTGATKGRRVGRGGVMFSDIDFADLLPALLLGFAIGSLLYGWLWGPPYLPVPFNVGVCVVSFLWFLTTLDWGPR